MVELSAMDTGESPAEVEAKIERMFKGQPKVGSRACWPRYDRQSIEHQTDC